MNYPNQTSIVVDINSNSNAFSCSNFSHEMFTCVKKYDLSSYIDTSKDLNNINYLYLNVHTNDLIEPLCPWNISNPDTNTYTVSYLLVDISLTCFVPNQCVLESNLPEIITITLRGLCFMTSYCSDGWVGSKNLKNYDVIKH